MSAQSPVGGTHDWRRSFAVAVVAGAIGFAALGLATEPPQGNRDDAALSSIENEVLGKTMTRDESATECLEQPLPIAFAAPTSGWTVIDVGGGDGYRAAELFGADEINATVRSWTAEKWIVTKGLPDWGFAPIDQPDGRVGGVDAHWGRHIDDDASPSPRWMVLWQPTPCATMAISSQDLGPQELTAIAEQLAS